MTAAVGAGTTGAFYSPSGVFNNYTSNPRTKDDHTIYKIVFSRRAFKQGIHEQKIHEYEYLRKRRRAHAERHQNVSDPYKSKANAMQPWGILFCFLGFLSCCMGFIVEWAATFPLCDMTPWMLWCRVAGIVVMSGGVVILTISKLYYHVNDTGTCKNPRFDYKVITKSDLAKAPRSKKTGTEMVKSVCNTIFYSASFTLLVSCLCFCVGFINEWATTFPGRPITKLERQVAAYIGIIGTAVSIALMLLSDLVHAWIVNNVEAKQKLALRAASLAAAAEDSQEELELRHRHALSEIDYRKQISDMYSDADMTIPNMDEIKVTYIQDNPSNPMQRVRFEDMVEYQEVTTLKGQSGGTSECSSKLLSSKSLSRGELSGETHYSQSLECNFNSLH